MRRTLRGAIGVLLAVAAAVPAPWALAQVPVPRVPGQPPPGQKIVRETISLSAGAYRLEEMKVELALLADITTFPYSLEVRAAGETLELFGFVPNDTVRRHALGIARGSTFLKVCNKIFIQTKPVAASSRCPPPMLQQEAAKLLRQTLGEPALEMSVGVRPDGRIVVAGSIRSVKSKLAVSRLFRRLPGCRAVVNQLTVRPIRHDHQLVVQATHNDWILHPPLPLDAKLQAPASFRTATKAPPTSRPAAVVAIPTNTPRKIVVTLPVKILVDQTEPTVQNVWEKRLRQRVAEASDILEQQCGVRLRVIEVGTWESDTKRTELSDLLWDFRKKVAPGGSRLVIGFTGLTASKDEAVLGCTLRPLHTHILIREWRPRTEPERLEVLVHELGHFLGACHSPDRDSVMRPKLGDGRVNFRAFCISFDPVNTKVMSLVAEELARGPVHSLEQLSPRTRERLRDIYSTLARTMPDNPTLTDAIRQLGQTPHDPLSARQQTSKE